MRRPVGRSLRTGLWCAALLATGPVVVPALAFHGEYPLEIVDGLQARLLKHAYRTAYAVGDFNGDGFNDLAIGIPYATVDGRRAAGKVIVIDGGADGLTAIRHVYHQAGSGRYDVPGANESGDLLGFSLAAGDFNNDGVCDLAVGAPGEDRPPRGIYSGVDAGAVFVALGDSERGLDFRRPGEAFIQDGEGRFDLAGDTGFGHLLGFSLAVGNFDGDDYDDIAAGLPGRWTQSGKTFEHDKGAVVVIGGTMYGPFAAGHPLTYTQGEYWQGGEGRFGLAGSDEQGDLVGFSLAAGDFDGDGIADLAVGAPGEGVEWNGRERGRAGAVMIAKGTGDGLDARPYPHSYNAGGEGRYNLRGTPEAGALLGFALAAGDFNGDGRADLAIGVPGRTVEGLDDAGAVVVARGADAGQGDLPELSGVWYLAEFTQSASDDRYDLPGQARTRALVGFSLAAGDFDRSSRPPRDDLAIGIPGQHVWVPDDPHGIYWQGRSVADAGAVAVRFGSGTGGIASAKAPRLFTQTAAVTDDLTGAAERDDALGMSIAAGPLDGGDTADLVIAVPSERVVNRTLGEVLPFPWDQMFVDGFTHVVFSTAGSGPDASAEDSCSFTRFTRGAQSAPTALTLGATPVNTLATALAPWIVEDGAFVGWYWTDLRLDATTEDDHIRGRAGVDAPDGRYRVDAKFWFTIIEGTIMPQMLMWEGDVEDGAVLGEPFPRDPSLLPAVAKVILLPSLAVEAIVEP